LVRAGNRTLAVQATNAGFPDRSHLPFLALGDPEKLTLKIAASPRHQGAA
jgi:hypothetical protein